MNYLLTTGGNGIEVLNPKENFHYLYTINTGNILVYFILLNNLRLIS